MSVRHSAALRIRDDVGSRRISSSSRPPTAAEQHVDGTVTQKLVEK